LFLVVTVAREAGSLYHTLETSSRSQGGWTVWFSKLIEGPIKWLAQSIGMQAPDLKLALMNRVQDMGNAQLARVGSLFGNVTSTLTEATIMFFTLYFFFQGAVRLRVLAVSWIPLPMGRVEELLDVVAETIRANVYGTLAVAAAQGAFTGIGFAIVGLPTAWLWGVVAAFCSLVPIVGPALVWVPAAASLVFSGAWIRALILVVWSIVIVAGLGDQLLRPLLLRGRMTMNTLLIVFSILGGLEYFGLVGLIAGPVVFSVAASLFRILGEMLRQNSAPADEVEPVSS
jgi:predicted PurR-regulated permease PerM